VKGWENDMLTYKKLFKLLIDRGMRKGELQKNAGITASIMARLAKDDVVRSDTIEKICTALNCQPGDIMEHIPEESIKKDPD
jgi:DNA-binding Xre family transcriptional regulator